jgi:tRNA1Val (adenine37-N6)-methyltransferase
MFRFKSFEIYQEHTPMKVCTDACIFGAYIDLENHTYMLDIGTGTGLLSLMLAQRSKLDITAVEIDAMACMDAARNFENSPYKDRIRLVNEPVQEFAAKSDTKFDVIVSNPPFFQNDLKSPKAGKNVAHHDTHLNFDELVTVAEKLLNNTGVLWILLPPEEMKTFIVKAVGCSLYLQSTLEVRHHALKKPFRTIASFKRTPAEHTITDELKIYEEDNKTYTPRFKALLKDYYTIF